ncbi:hypothetical protein GF324_07370 [bacterium]|nr:hypothetical protein [bacterium]
MSSETSPEHSRDASYPRLDKLGLLVAGITHNLNGSLTAMLGHLDLLMMINPDLKDQLEKIVKMGKRLRGEINMMMEKADADGSLRIEEINLATLISLELDFFRGDPRMKHEIEKHYEPPEEFPTFHGLTGDFTHIFDQLLMNAIEAVEEKEEKVLTITLEVIDDNILMTLTDNGVGMDEATLARAREPFFTTKQPRPGGRQPEMRALGIGLTHAYTLAEDLGCTLTLESELGMGTTAALRIPYKEIDAKFRQKMLEQMEDDPFKRR